MVRFSIKRLTLDKIAYFVDSGKGPCPFGAGFRGFGQGEHSKNGKQAENTETGLPNVFWPICIYWREDINQHRIDLVEVDAVGPAIYTIAILVM